jgi:hypothetical protein
MISAFRAHKDRDTAAYMSRVCLVDGIYRQRADGVVADFIVWVLQPASAFRGFSVEQIRGQRLVLTFVKVIVGDCYLIKGGRK